METQGDKKKRRSKKDSDGRSYTCECGKSYLSYQALYTHKRTKHIDLIKQEDEPKKKRGRPKGIKSLQNSYDPASPLGDHVLAKKIQDWKENRRPLCCDEVFAEFLIEKSKFLSKREYRNIAGSVINLRNCLNKHYVELNEPNIEDLEQDYTAVKGSGLLPKISNIYVLNFLPKNNIEFDKDFEVQFMLEFCEWLTKKNYTDLEVSIIEE